MYVVSPALPSVIVISTFSFTQTLSVLSVGAVVFGVNGSLVVLSSNVNVPGSNLSVDEMIEKLLEGGHVMYVMYENNGLRYEMNIMYSDDTIYLIVWVFDESAACGDDCEHEH